MSLNRNFLSLEVYQSIQLQSEKYCQDRIGKIHRLIKIKNIQEFFSLRIASSKIHV